MRAIYRKLSRAWGRQHWWPAETPFEVIVGAILTQNTSWTNVERAMANLRAAGVLSVEGIRELPLPKLEALVRSSGYFRQKAQRLKNFVAFVDARYEGSLEHMFTTPTEELRAELLAQNGIGPETADSILLYAGHHESFCGGRLYAPHPRAGTWRYQPPRNTTRFAVLSSALCSAKSR